MQNVFRKMSSKKGFTLVELVVVIAILAILAAIAIPAVIGIINSANESQKASDAATIDYACKTYYTGIVSGTICSENFDAKLSGDAIPSASDSAGKKRLMARNCTVAGALEYEGMYRQLVDKIEEFGYDKDGNIHSLTDSAYSTWNLTPISAEAKLDFQALNYV